MPTLSGTSISISDHSMVPFLVGGSTGFWMYGKSVDDTVVSYIFKPSSNAWTAWNPMPSSFTPSGIVHFQSAQRTMNNHVYLAYDEVNDNQKVALCYCSQDSTECADDEWKCKEYDLDDGFNFIVKTAAAFIENNDGKVLLIGNSNNGGSAMIYLSISEWTGEDPTPTMSVEINLFSDFPKSPEFALLEGKLTALGGEDADGVSVNTMYEFNPATHGWTPGIYNMQSKRKSHSATVVPESWLCKETVPETTTASWPSVTTEEDGISLEDQIIIISAVFGVTTVLLLVGVAVLGYFYSSLKNKVKKGKEGNGRGQRKPSYQMYSEDPEPASYNRQSSNGGDYGKGWESKPSSRSYSNVMRQDEGRVNDQREHSYDDRFNNNRQSTQNRYNSGRKSSNDPRSSLNQGPSVHNQPRGYSGNRY